MLFFIFNMSNKIIKLIISPLNYIFKQSKKAKKKAYLNQSKLEFKCGLQGVKNQLSDEPIKHKFMFINN